MRWLYVVHTNNFKLLSWIEYQRRRPSGRPPPRHPCTCTRRRRNKESSSPSKSLGEVRICRKSSRGPFWWPKPKTCDGIKAFPISSRSKMNSVIVMCHLRKARELWFYPSLGVQIGHVQAVSLLVPVAHGAAVAPVAVVPVGTAGGSAIFRTPRPPPRVFHFNGISINEQFTLSFGKRRTNTRPSTARSDIIQMRNGASTKLGDHCSWEHFLNPNDRLLFIPSFI